MAAEDLRGNEVLLEVGRVAHGGHCVARLDGRVVFVRHALPGERVRVRITEGTTASRFLRADAVDVVRAAAGRVVPPCPFAGPGRCGGCDFQHADLATQRDLLASVVHEQLVRLAGVDREVVVEAVPEPGSAAVTGLGWRTRVTWAVDRGRTGLRKHRSHEVVPVDDCRIADPRLPVVSDRTWAAAHVETACSSRGDSAVLADGSVVAGRTRLRETVNGRDFQVAAGGFWQVHPTAAATLVDAVLSLGGPRAGERAVDLYSGVGLFTAFLAEAVGPGGRVVSVESDAAAVRCARRNLHDLPQARLVGERVDRALASAAVGESCDLLVLDPPRVGARAPVVRAVASLTPSRVVYVACEPAALARDVATFAELGYRLVDLRTFALFPMTHHVECVALLMPG
ncbi:MAG: class I SAM-dependent RNA methyltransferase [Nocardioidaceae bacterium]